MYEDLCISVLKDGGYTVTQTPDNRGSYNPHIAAFSSKSDLLKWLDLNIEDRSPDLIDRRPKAPASAKSKVDDEIPF